MTNSADPELTYLDLSVYKGRAYPGSAGPRLTFTILWTYSADNMLKYF